MPHGSQSGRHRAGACCRSPGSDREAGTQLRRQEESDDSRARYRKAMDHPPILHSRGFCPRERTLPGPLRTWAAFRKLLEPFLTLLPAGLQDEYGFEFWTRDVEWVLIPPQGCPEGKRTTWHPIHA